MSKKKNGFLIIGVKEENEIRPQIERFHKKIWASLTRHF